MTEAEKFIALQDAATPGIWSAKEWRICTMKPFAYVLDTAHNKLSRNSQNAANAEFIAFARNTRIAHDLRDRDERLRRIAMYAQFLDSSSTARKEILDLTDTAKPVQ